MTLYNNVQHLSGATASILAQTYGDFTLVMLDDGSTDGSEPLARSLATQDPRVRYIRHAQRQGMVPTWREAFTLALSHCPTATYFAWVSDHDYWHPEWLAQMVAALDAHPAVVLAYPVTQRMAEDGTPIEKEPRSFQTVGVSSRAARWRAFCHEGVGSGDMVYGLMRASALMAAGTFRSVLNPDRLLIAELTLQGQILQIPDSLWSRRRSAVASIARQRTTLFAGPPPRWFWLPPTLQHALMIAQSYLFTPDPPVRIGGLELGRMLLRYQVTSLWRLYRKTEMSKSFGRGVDNLHFVKKLTKKGVLLLVHHTLVGIGRARARLRRWRRKAVYETLMAWHRGSGRLRRLGRRVRYEVGTMTHRLGFRGSGGPRSS